MPVEFDEIKLAALARELVMNIRSYQTVFADYHIDENDYYEIEKNPFFKRIKDQLTLEWNATTSTGERMRIMALAGTEVLLPTVLKRMKNEQEPLASVLKGFDIITRVAGLDNAKDAVSKPGERFVIQINLGGETETYDKAVAPKVIEHDGGIDGKTDNGRPQQVIEQPIRPAG